MKSRRRWTAFCYSVPIGALGGLIGLGGAEFRLPVLVGPLGYRPKQAVPLNLLVSLVTLAASLATRGRVLNLSAIDSFSAGIAAIICGAVTAAFVGTSVVVWLSETTLRRVLVALLASIAALLIAEGVAPKLPPFLPDSTVAHVSAGIAFGLAIGLVSSLLGVAGGELIIPTLVFAYGADIKTAGTASLLISLPTVLVGIIRYARRGMLSDKQALKETVAPMGIGSIIGVLIGGALVGNAPDALLKIVLGIILAISAATMFAHSQPNQQPTA